MQATRDGKQQRNTKRENGNKGEAELWMHSDLESVFAHHNAQALIKTRVLENYKRVVIPVSILILSRVNICSGVVLHFKADRAANSSPPFPKSLRKFAVFETLYLVNSVTLRSLLSFCSNRKAGCLTNSSGFDLAILRVPYVIPKNADKTTPAAVLH